MKRRDFIGLGLSSIAAAAAMPVVAKSPASALPRTLTLYHLHTDERLSLTYRVGEHYSRSALRRLNHFLRDFRTGEVTAIDPRIFDLMYDVQERVGHHDGVFEIIGGYRSPKTNAMLRRTSSGVAKRSLHMSGQAVDMRLRGSSLRHVRDAAVHMGRGGVGYYPRSDFVHLDTGRVRHWG
jgi:uncharacterized protein YcbK (DUF882 family)